MAGYSGTPLIKKLGIRPGQKVLFVNAPAGFDRTLGALPEDVEKRRQLRGRLDYIQIFSDSTRDLRRRMSKAKQSLNETGTLWISWPKKGPGVATDLDGNIVRRIGLEAGLVDVKVCAVDETWSGLKFVYRIKDRRG